MRRGRRRMLRRLVVPVLAAGCLAVCSSAAGSERALHALWVLHEEAGNEHAHVAATCLRFAEQDAADTPFAPLGHTLAAWHLLKLDRRDEARALLLPYTDGSGGGGLARGARQLARAWLTRLDRERVVEALEAYRVREVQYPESLAELAAWPRLPADPALPLRDRWGDRWIYRRERLQSMPGLAGQRYTLTSRTLDGTSALSTALAIPYGTRIGIEPVRVLGGPGRAAIVHFVRAPAGDEVPSDRIAAGVGGEVEGVVVAHVGPQRIVLADRLHWVVLQRPRPEGP